jgi:hypothetical protein
LQLELLVHGLGLRSHCSSHKEQGEWLAGIQKAYRCAAILLDAAPELLASSLKLLQAKGRADRRTRQKFKSSSGPMLCKYAAGREARLAWGGAEMSICCKCFNEWLSMVALKHACR